MQSAALLLVLTASAIAVDTWHQPEPTTDCVYQAELNHYYDGEGRLVFSQMIWRDFDGDRAKLEIVAWRMVSTKGENRGIVPSRRTDGMWESRWWDGNVFRRVVAKAFTVTWTQYDREVWEREGFHKEWRRGLRGEVQSFWGFGGGDWTKW